jgi:hypothetical protein
MPPRETTTPSGGVAADPAGRITSLAAGAPRKFTAAEVELHNVPEDVWVIVHNKAGPGPDTEGTARNGSRTWQLHGQSGEPASRHRLQLRRVHSLAHHSGNPTP